MRNTSRLPPSLYFLSIYNPSPLNFTTRITLDYGFTMEGPIIDDVGCSDISSVSE